MKEINVPSSSPSTPPKQSPPKLGIVSLIIAILAIVLGCVVFQVPVMYPPPTNASQFVDYMKMLGALVVGVIVFSVIGLILGIAGTSKESKKSLRHSWFDSQSLECYWLGILYGLRTRIHVWRIRP